MLYARRKKESASGEREFVSLKLERPSVAFFPLAWTIVHPIDEESPLREIRDPQELRQCESEFLVLLNGFDETFSQIVHTRSSYKGDEVVWAAYRTLDTFYGALPYWDREDIEMGDSVVAKLADQAVAAGATDVSRIDDCTVVLIDAAKAASAVRAWIEAHFQ